MTRVRDSSLVIAELLLHSNALVAEEMLWKERRKWGV